MRSCPIASLLLWAAGLARALELWSTKFRVPLRVTPPREAETVQCTLPEAARHTKLLGASLCLLNRHLWPIHYPGLGLLQLGGDWFIHEASLDRIRGPWPRVQRDAP